MRSRFWKRPWLAWSALLLVAIGFWLQPISYRVIRLCLLLSVVTLWASAVFLLRKKRNAGATVIALGIVLSASLCLPGRDVEVARLRAEYTEALRLYEGTPYVWGGENRLGVDCSGLVRNGLMDANMRLGFRTANARAIRTAIRMWWYDCSARALRDGYKSLTDPLFDADSINDISSDRIAAGDIAVTINGVHVLAYIGDGLWIEADPTERKTIVVRTPSTNYWFTVPVRVLRWSQLTETKP